MSTKTFEEWKKGYYVEHGFISSEKEMEAAWNASRAALLADEPDVEKTVTLLSVQAVLPQDPRHRQVLLDAITALLSMLARIKALKEQVANLKGHAEAMAGWVKWATKEGLPCSFSYSLDAYRRDHPEGT